MSAIDFGKVFGQAFSYTMSKDRLLPIFVLNLIGFLSILSGIIKFIETENLIISQEALLSGMLNDFIIVGILIIGVGFLNLFFIITYSNNSFRYPNVDKPLSTSYNYTKKNYLKILSEFILFFIIVFSLYVLISIVFVSIIGNINIILILSIILSIFLLLYVPITLLENKKIEECLKKSYNIFLKNKLNIIIFWIIFLLIKMFIISVFIIIIGLVTYPFVYERLNDISIDKIELNENTITLIQENITILLFIITLLSFTFAFVNVFVISSLALFYKQLKNPLNS